MSNADRFIELFNRADAALRARAGLDDHGVKFNEVVGCLRADPLVKPSIHRLMAYGRLRNAIVHDIRYPSASVIAEPRKDEVERLEKLVLELEHPTRLSDVSLPRPEVLSMSAGLMQILLRMLDQDFSQVVVENEDEYVLLSAAAITRWLSEGPNQARIAEAAIADAFVLEDGSEFAYASTSDPVASLRVLFERTDGRPRMQAVLVTGDGTPAGIPIGIVTAWDLLTPPLSSLLHDGHG